MLYHIQRKHEHEDLNDISVIMNYCVLREHSNSKIKTFFNVIIVVILIAGY